MYKSWVGLTGRLVVPEVYSIMPAAPGWASPNWTCSLAPPPACLASSRWTGGFEASSSVARTSRALGANLADETSKEAWLCSRMYCSSEAGKAGDSGTAMARAATAARSVTSGTQREEKRLVSFDCVVSARASDIRISLAPSRGVVVCLKHGLAHLRNRSRFPREWRPSHLLGPLLRVSPVAAGPLRG